MSQGCNRLLLPRSSARSPITGRERRFLEALVDSVQWRVMPRYANSHASGLRANGKFITTCIRLHGRFATNLTSPPGYQNTGKTLELVL